MADLKEKKYLSITGLQYFWEKVQTFLATTYVKLEDYTPKVEALEAADSANTAAIEAEVTRATGVESGLQTAIDNINTELGTKVAKTDYAVDKAQVDADIAALKAAVGEGGEGGEGLLDMVSKNIAAINTLVGPLTEGTDGANDNTKSVRTIATEVLTKALIPENAQESMDTLQEISDWIQNHPGEAATMNTNIVDLQGRMTTAEGEIDTLQAKDTELEGKINGKVEQSVFDALQQNVSALEGKVEGLEGEDYTAKIEALQAVVDNAIDLKDDLTYEGMYNTQEAPVTTVKADIAKAKAAIEAEASRADAAEKKNAADITVLTGRVDTAEGEIDALQAKDTELEGEIDALQAKDTELEGEIDSLTGRVGDVETALGGLSDTYVSHEEFEAAHVEITNAEIDDMFVTE